MYFTEDPKAFRQDKEAQIDSVFNAMDEVV